MVLKRQKVEKQSRIQRYYWRWGTNDGKVVYDKSGRGSKSGTPSTVQGLSSWSGNQREGEKPPKLKAFVHMYVKMRWQICQLLCYSKAGQGGDSSF